MNAYYLEDAVICGECVTEEDNATLVTDLPDGFTCTDCGTTVI